MKKRMFLLLLMLQLISCRTVEITTEDKNIFGEDLWQEKSIEVILAQEVSEDNSGYYIQYFPYFIHMMDTNDVINAYDKVFIKGGAQYYRELVKRKIPFNLHVLDKIKNINSTYTYRNYFPHFGNKLYQFDKYFRPIKFLVSKYLSALQEY